MRDLPGGRRKSREILFRVLFESDLSGDDPLELLEFTLGRFRLTADGRDYVIAVMRTWSGNAGSIDERIRVRLARWELKRLSAVVRTALRLAVAELLTPGGVPAPVVIDQAIELVRRYGEEGAAGFVNGVLDPIGSELRPEEMKERGNRG